MGANLLRQILRQPPQARAGEDDRRVTVSAKDWAVARAGAPGSKPRSDCSQLKLCAGPQARRAVCHGVFFQGITVGQLVRSAR